MTTMLRDSASSTPSRLAVLISGGLDSAILLGEAVRERITVFPLYVRSGLSWEEVELLHLRRFLDALAGPNLKKLHLLEMPTGDLYDSGHWSVSGTNVPGAETPDEAVFLPGRNVLLLGKALLWCHLYGVPALGLAPLGSNPFPDATPEFFQDFTRVVNQSVQGAVSLWLPYSRLHKAEVMQRGRDLPLGLTFSCIQPRGERHCGVCNKCAERQQAFRAIAMPDPTDYARS
jgi:7-cyano-7-deazaguanine synthase